jgi:hypothetical protein
MFETFIHPALNDAIADARGRKRYLRIQQIPVGDGLPWRPEYGHVTQIERLLQTDDTASFRDSVHAVLAEILSVIESGDMRFARAKAEASEVWRSLQQYADVDACGEVLLWLDELLETL